MKIADFGKAITSYIESPTTAQKLQAKEKAQTLGRTLLADGTEIIPQKKPKQLKDLFEKINRTVLAVRSNTIPPELIVPNLEKETQEYIKDGVISGADARKFAIERQKYWDNWIKENPGGTTPSFEFDNEGNAIELSQEQITERINESDGGRVKREDLAGGTKLMDEYLGAQKEYQKAVDNGFQGTYEEFLRYKYSGSFADGGRAKFQEGLSVQTLDPVFPTQDPTSTDFKPLNLPGAIIPPLAIGAGAKRIKDIFFSKKEDDKKDLKKSDDKNNLIKGDGPDEPDPLDDLAQSYLIDEAVERLKRKEMDLDKRDDKTLLARDLDLDIPKSGLYELRKKENKNFLKNRLKLLKNKGVNFDGYYSTSEIANLLGIKTGSGVRDFVIRKNVPMVKKGLFNVLTLNDFLTAYEPTKERIQKAPPLDLANLARQDFLKDNKSPFFERFKRLKFEPVSKKEYIPPEIRSIYDKYDLSQIEGGHPFPVEFFTKEFGKKGTLKNKRQFDWIYRNKDKLFNQNDLVLQSKDINAQGGPFYNAIAELKPLYKKLGEYVDKYEGKGAVKNKKDIDAISKLNLDIMKIIGNSKEEVQNFIKENPDSKLTIPKMKIGGLHGAIFDYETGEVELYAPDKQVLFESGAVEDIETEKGTMSGQKLKIAESFLDVLNQVVDDKKDLAKLLNYFEGKMLPKFQKGGSVYGKYAGQIAKLP